MTVWGPKNGSQIVKQMTKIGSGGSLGPPQANWILILNLRVHFGAHFGTPKGPQGSPKSFKKASLTKNMILGVVFFMFWALAWFFIIFFSVFNRFLEGPTLTKACYGQCFVRFAIFQKNRWKGNPGDLKIDPRWPKIYQKELQMAQNDPKKYFFEGLIFEWIFGPKNEPKRDPWGLNPEPHPIGTWDCQR